MKRMMGTRIKDAAQVDKTQMIAISEKCERHWGSKEWMKYFLKGRYEGRKEKKWGVRYSKLACFSNREPHTTVAHNGIIIVLLDPRRWT